MKRAGVLGRWSTRTQRAGFTLIELLLVVALVATMLGIGLGLFARIDLGDRIARSQVQNVLRSAHNWAVARQAPARVVIDAKGGRMRAEGLQTIGTWHFEREPLEGAFQLDGANLGGRIAIGGFQGNCLSFAGTPSRSRAEIAVHKDPAYDLTSGFQVRCAVRPSGLDGGALLDLGGAVGLETLDGGAARAWFSSVTVDERGETKRGPRVTVTTDRSALLPDRWALVEAQYDRRVFRVLVDGVVLVEVAEEAAVTNPEKALVLSPGQTPFPGAIDNLVIAAVAAADETELPKGVAFSAKTPAVIAFAPGGALDRERHREPARFSLVFESGREESIVVGLYGTVE